MKYIYPILALVYLLTNYATLGIMPRIWVEINGILKGQGLYLFVGIYSILGAVLLCYLLYFEYLKSIRNITYLIVFTSIFLLMFYFENNPGEKFHMLQYGIFGGLLCLSLSSNYSLVKKKFYLIGFLISFFAGGLDEVIQGILPNRVFTWHDVIINGTSSFMVLLLLNLLRKEKSTEPKKLSRTNF